MLLVKRGMNISSWLYAPSYQNYCQYMVPRYLPSVISHLQLKETLFLGQTVFNWWIDVERRGDEGIKSWLPHAKLRQLWRAVPVPVLAVVGTGTFVPAFSLCSVWLHSLLPLVVLILECSLVNWLHTNFHRDGFLGKLLCNSDI